MQGVNHIVRHIACSAWIDPSLKIMLRNSALPLWVISIYPEEIYLPELLYAVERRFGTPNVGILWSERGSNG